jgi:hypothetical protein
VTEKAARTKKVRSLVGTGFKSERFGVLFMFPEVEVPSELAERMVKEEPEYYCWPEDYEGKLEERREAARAATADVAAQAEVDARGPTDAVVEALYQGVPMEEAVLLAGKPTLTVPRLPRYVDAAGNPTDEPVPIPELEQERLRLAREKAEHESLRARGETRTPPREMTPKKKGGE